MEIRKIQSLSYNNLLSYSCTVSKDETMDLINYMCKNMNVLNNTINGPPLIKTNGKENDKITEILIPIVENRNDIQPEFRYMHNFNLNNILVFRYTGSFDKLDAAKDKFIKYIGDNNYSLNGMVYYSVLDIGSDNNHTIDIIVSVN